MQAKTLYLGLDPENFPIRGCCRITDGRLLESCRDPSLSASAPILPKNCVFGDPSMARLNGDPKDEIFGENLAYATEPEKRNLIDNTAGSDRSLIRQHPLQHLVHYPVIRTEKLDGTQALPLWPQFTHVIFTSRSAVRHWWEEGMPFGEKKAIAIGEATANELRCRSVFPKIAPEPTQEGVIALLETMDLEKAYLFLPRSKRARNLLPKYLEQKEVSFFAVDLYDTVLQKPQPIPNLADFEEIVFTSPSTVDGFLQIFKTFPKHCKLTAIGPITESTLTKMQSLRYH